MELNVCWLQTATDQKLVILQMGFGTTDQATECDQRRTYTTRNRRQYFIRF